MNAENDRIPFEAPSIEELQPLFPGYELETLIAQGGMGAVYRATQTALDRPVAIKILPRELSEVEAFRQSFTAEAKAMARLNHPNLIGVYDFGDIEGMFFIVMEYVEGQSLHYAAGEFPVQPAKAIELVSAICQALGHAHEGGVLHRDIKPGNILLDAQHRPKIGDFGLASRIGEQANADEVIYGTPGYAAPELTENGTIDQRADVFSVGVLLHRLLTGQEPTGHPLPAASSLCGCSLSLDTVIAKATDPDPRRRFQDVHQLANSLSQTSKAVALPAPRLASSPPAVAPARPRPAPASPPAYGNRSGGRVAALVILIVAAIGGAVYLNKRSSDQEKAAASADSPIVQARIDPSRKAVAVPASTSSRESARESVAQALARLKGKLSAGERSEFPAGTVARDGSHFLLIDWTTTWDKARDLAEEHGAHLAVLPSAPDQEWLRKNFSFQKPVWVGALLGAGNQWQWVDGTAWHADASLSADSDRNRHLAFSGVGGLFPAGGAEKYAPILQWRADGTNPGTLEAQLQRLATSAKSGNLENLAFPVDTRTFGDSHFFHLEVSLSWDEARKHAESLGAYLAVPSSPEEHAWICNTFHPVLKKDRAIWLGGYRLKPGERWQWLTHEAWNNSGWQSEQVEIDPERDRLLLQGATKSTALTWSAQADREDVATGILLEWSTPKDPVQVAGFEPKPWLTGVNRKIGTMVDADLREFEKARKSLVQEYSRSMGRLLRKEEKEPTWGGRGPRPGPGGFDWGGQRRRSLEEIDENLKEATKSGQLMQFLPATAPDALHEQQKKSEKELRLLEDAFDAKLIERLAYYQEGIRKKAADLADKGYLDTAHLLRELIAPLENNLPAFLRVLFAEAPRATLPWEPRTEPGAPGAADQPPEENPEPLFPEDGPPADGVLREFTPRSNGS